MTRARTQLTAGWIIAGALFMASPAGAQDAGTNKVALPAPATTLKEPSKPAIPGAKSVPAPSAPDAKPLTEPAKPNAAPPTAAPAPPKPAPAPVQKPDYFESILNLVENKPIGFTPKAANGLDLIQPKSGAGGVSFDQSMSDVIQIWGKPHAITMSTYDNEPLQASDITLHMGASRFRFLNNKLVQIVLHRSNLPNAAFASGIGFDATEEQVLAKMGKPESKRGNTLEYRIEGTSVKIQLAKHFKTGAVSPIAITLSKN